ncbi:MAG TPA: hypothetical protein VK891_02990, partial [Euzebyales bacterium]|nr:hypothetical protein [Euzebyales bacterium]
MRRVIDLDTGETGRGELGEQRRGHRAATVLRHAGMGQHDRAARRPQQLEATQRIDGVLRHVCGPTVLQVAVECVGDVGHVAGLDHGAGNVWTPDRRVAR